CRFAHKWVSPRPHRMHCPQGTTEFPTTRSPTFQPDTPPPTLAISPQYSWPITSGGVRRSLLPLNVSSSEPQIPQACTLTSTSPAATSGTGISTTSNLPHSG